MIGPVATKSAFAHTLKPTRIKLKTFLLFRRPVLKDWAFVVFLAFLALNLYVFIFLNNRVPELAKGIENLFTDFNIFKLTWYTYLYFLQQHSN